MKTPTLILVLILIVFGYAIYKSQNIPIETEINHPAVIQEEVKIFEEVKTFIEIQKDCGLCKG